eukprot:12895809-Alexandrium_andersonii.AAC.1
MPAAKRQASRAAGGQHPRRRARQVRLAPVIAPAAPRGPPDLRLPAALAALPLLSRSEPFLP